MCEDKSFLNRYLIIQKKEGGHTDRPGYAMNEKSII